MTVEIAITPGIFQILCRRRLAPNSALLSTALLTVALQLGLHASAQSQIVAAISKPQTNQAPQLKPARPDKNLVPQQKTASSPTQVAETLPTQAAVAAQTPPAPQTPDWPANNKPIPANVIWDSHGLRVEADNASLIQTLHEVALETGAKIQGIRQDQRIFGTYGPGSAQDVLSQLLDGSGYNVILVGDLGHGTPRQILLSPRASDTAQAGTDRNPSGETAEEQEPIPVPQQPQFEPQSDPQFQPQFQPQPEPQQPINPFGGGSTQPRSPQEIILEMQQRALQIQQQQQPQ